MHARVGPALAGPPPGRRQPRRIARPRLRGSHGKAAEQGDKGDAVGPYDTWPAAVPGGGPPAALDRGHQVRPEARRQARLVRRHVHREAIGDHQNGRPGSSCVAGSAQRRPERRPNTVAIGLNGRASFGCVGRRSAVRKQKNKEASGSATRLLARLGAGRAALLAVQGTSLPSSNTRP